MSDNKNLEPAGVQLKTEGSEAFDRAIKQVNARFDSMMSQMKKLAKESKTTNAVLKKMVPDGEMDKALEKTNQRMARLMDRMRKMQADLRTTKKELKEISDSKVSPDASGFNVTDILSKLPGFGKISGLFNNIPGIQQLTQQIPALGKLSPMLGQITAGFGSAGGGALTMAAGVGIAVVAVGALAKGFIALGQRGAAMTGVIQAFAAITQNAGIDGFNMLAKLQEAAGYTITRFEGMRLTNLALAGSSQILANEFGNKLPQLMEVARAQARATRQDVNYLFESLVTGIKRGSPLLIDNTGLVLKVGAANEAYAASIGKTADQLTAEEQKVAILNATLAAGASAVDMYGKGQATAAERIQRVKATFNDMLDRLAVAVQPMFNMILEIGQGLLDVIAWPINHIIAPAVYLLGKLFSEGVLFKLRLFADFVKTAFGPAIQNLQEWINYGVIAVGLLGKAVGWLRDAIYKVLGPPIRWVAKAIGSFFKLLSPRRFFEGGANAIGSLAGGIAWAAANLVGPAVVQLATMVADFLCGFSPPPKGPLSRIDEGGANVIDAWLEGMGMASMAPVTEIAAQVDKELGTVGKLGFSQVENRLKGLDLALRPYQEALDIAKAKMAALTDPLNKVKDIIQKKLDIQLQKFLQGGVDAESVRTIDRQQAALDGYTASLEDSTTEAEYQLVLAQARQAQERALLNIQKNRLGEQQKITDATEKPAAAEKAGGGAASALPELGGGESLLMGGGGDPLAEFAGVDASGVDAQMAGLADAFSRGFNNVAGDSLAALSTQGDMIQTQMDRIAGSTPGRVISTGWNALFGDGPTSLRGKFNSFVTQFEAGWNTTFGEQGTIATLWATFKSNIDISVADVGRVFSEFSLASLITTFRGAVGLDNIGIPGIVNRFRQTIHQNFDSGGLLGVIFGAFSLENIRSTFSTVFGEEGSIRGYLNSLLDFVTGFFSGDGLFAQAFAAFGDTLRPVFLDPVLGVFNGLIDMVIDVFNRVIDVVDSALGRIEDAARFTGLNVDFGLDHMNSGDYHLSLPGAKIGGVFGPGLLKTHKDEVIASGASKLTVFPVRWVKAMERIASGVTPTPRYAAGVGSVSSSTVNNTANSHTVNFNVRDNRQNYRMKLSEARAFGWSH